jgi:hypothetical protein
MLHTPRPSHAQTLLPTLPKGIAPEVLAEIEINVCHVLERHGLDAFAMSRDAAIVHEAGHAIVGTHEGLTIRRVTIFSRSVPAFGPCWGGCTMDVEGWMTGPDTSAEDDLRHARFVVAGLAGEVKTGRDRPGSSLDEECISRELGRNAAVKLADPLLSAEAFTTFAQELWHEKVWVRAGAILYENREPFNRLAQHLKEKEKIQGGKLRKILAQVKRITP